MTTQEGMDRETFNRLAAAAGLDIGETAHMDELYAYVRGLVASLQPLRDMDLEGVEPATAYFPPRD